MIFYWSPIISLAVVPVCLVVSAWVGDHIRTGKPPWHRTRHPGRLSLSHLSVGRQEWVLAVAPATTREETASPA